MLERPFVEEQDLLEVGGSSDNREPEYTFEGFTVEFSEKIMLTPMATSRSLLAKGQTASNAFSLDPNRTGTFIIPDIYPCDLGENPPFHVLPGMVVDGKEIVGCVVKASDGVQWGVKGAKWDSEKCGKGLVDCEEWFKRSWKKIREVAGDRYGVDFFRGCYHYLRFSLDGAKQADYFCDLVDAAGGWGEGDLMPWMDIEEAGQGPQWAQHNLETTTNTVRKQLSDQVTACATAFIKRFKERTGLRIAVYGRGIFRDLHMTNCKFGSDSAVNPAYTPAPMPKMDSYGVPIDDISLWQLCGDGEVHLPGYPSKLPRWGATDYSVYIDGARKTTLKSLRDRCLARP
jgi:hypothetical protein